MDTKETIQVAALNLFSKKGYSSASVRDIAGAIGIKDSSLYFHFKNKQAILDSLTEKYISMCEEMMGFVSHISEGIVTISDKDFYNFTEKYVRGYFMNEFICKFIMIMDRERSNNEILRKLYICWCIEKPIEFQMKVFEKLQQIGYLKNYFVKQMALEYYSPIFLFFNQYLAHEFGQNNDAFLNAVMESAKGFIKIYKQV